MGHKKQRGKPSAASPDQIPVENTVVAAGSEAGGAAGSPPDRPVQREAPGRRPRWLRRLVWACVIAAAVIVILRLVLWLSLPWIINKTMTCPTDGGRGNR